MSRTGSNGDGFGRSGKLQVRGLRLTHGRRRVLDDVSFEIAPGSLVGLVGPSGSGKTTLLRALCGIHKANTGSIHWQPDPPTIGYVPQTEGPDPVWPLRSEDFVLMGRYRHGGITGRVTETDRVKARDALVECGAGDLAGRRIATLSGGEFQRVLIARALAAEPDLLLLDEPTASLDFALTASLLRLLLDLNRRHRMTVLLASHDINLLTTVASAFLVLGNGCVRLETPESLFDSTHARPLLGERFTVGRVNGQTVVLPDLSPSQSESSHV